MIVCFQYSFSLLIVIHKQNNSLKKVKKKNLNTPCHPMLCMINTMLDESVCLLSRGKFNESEVRLNSKWAKKDCNFH